jgi:phosphocarrier protein
MSPTSYTLTARTLHWVMAVLMILMLAAGLGTTVELETHGEREQEAALAILALFSDKFGEGE